MKAFVLFLVLLTAANARPPQAPRQHPVLVHYVGGQGGRINVYFWVILTVAAVQGGVL